jgi:hypothetical protein
VPSARISTSIWQTIALGTLGGFPRPPATGFGWRSQPTPNAIYPVRLRCSSVTYVKFAPSSRLAGRTPRLPTDGRSSGGRH